MADLSSLRIFVTVVDKGSFTEAARELHLTQPAVTYKIKTLEEEFALVLLSRGKAGVSPTPAGEILYKYAKRIIGLYADLSAEMEEYARGVKDLISVGACPMIGEFFLPGILEAFRENFPKVEVEAKISYFPPIFEGLLNGNLDVGLLEIKASHKEILIEEVWQESFLLIVSPNCHLQELSLQDLKGKRVFLREEAVGMKAILEDHFREKGMRLKDFDVVAVSGSTEAIKEMVKGGMGVTFLPRGVVTGELERGELREAKLAEGLPFLKCYVAYRKRNIPPKVAKFVKFVRTFSKT